jgi:hypothetical protein
MSKRKNKKDLPLNTSNNSFEVNKKIKTKNYILALLFVIFTSYFVLDSYLSKFPFSLDTFFDLINPFNYFTFNIKNTLIYNLKEIFKVTLLFASFTGFGELILIFILRKEELSEIEKFILRYAFGISLTLIFSIISGFIGIINKILYLTYLSCGVLIFAYFFVKKEIKFDEIFSKFKKSNKLILLTFLIFAIINLIQSLAPEIFYDTYVYHLGVPSYWQVYGKIIDMPYNLYSKLSLNHSVLYLFSMETFGNQTPLLLNYLTSIICFLSIWWLFESFLTEKASLLAALIFYTIFHVSQSSQSAASDILAAFPSIISFYFTLKFIENQKFIYIFLIGFFGGFAFGTKYNTSFLIISYFFIIIYTLYKNKFNFKETLYSIFIFSGGFLIFTLPWFIKNLLNYSNPLFPFMYKIFNKNISEIDSSKINAFILEVKQFSTFNLWEWIKHPFLISTGQIPNSEFFSFIFIILLPIGLILKSQNKILKYLWFSFIFSWLLWSFNSTYVRHLFSSFFIMALLASYYLNITYGILNYILKTIVIFSIILNLNWLMYSFRTEERYKVTLGLENRDEYLSYTHLRYPNPSYSLIKYINENPDYLNAKVLFLCEPKVFYMKRKFESSSVFDRNPLIDITITSKNGEEIYEKIRKMGYTHILANIAEIIRINKGYKIFYWSDKDLKKFDDFYNNHLEVERDFESIKEQKLYAKSILYKIVEKKKKNEPNYILKAIELSQK